MERGFVAMPRAWLDGHKRALSVEYAEAGVDGRPRNPFLAAIEQWMTPTPNLGLKGASYLLLRCLLYTVSVGVYYATHIYDDIERMRMDPTPDPDRNFVFRPQALRWLTGAVTMLTLLDTLLRVVINNKNLHYRFDFYDVINVGLAAPVILILVGGEGDRYTPTFFHIWTVRACVIHLIVANDIDRHRRRVKGSESVSLTADVVKLFLTFTAIIVTAMCGIEHLERANDVNGPYDLFDAFWFVFVTFSTVGYGDLFPVDWLGRLWVIGMIVVALVVLPIELNKIAEVTESNRRTGGKVTSGGHVIVCSGSFETASVRVFLLEFFARGDDSMPNVVFLSPKALPSSLESLLLRPRWKRKCKYIRGSALDNSDLIRANLQDAEGVFILPELSFSPHEADRRTVLRSWAMNDHDPACRQYIQLQLPEHGKQLEGMHGSHVCANEMKHVLLAHSTTCTGISTLVTMLLRTSDGTKRQDEIRDILDARERYKNQLQHALDGPKLSAAERTAKLRVIESILSERPMLYGMVMYAECSGQELYATPVATSKFLKEYVDANFTLAAFDALKYRITLLGVHTHPLATDSALPPNTIVLNPGMDYRIQASDTLYYMAEDSEELLFVDGNRDLFDMQVFHTKTDKKTDKRKYKKKKKKSKTPVPESDFGSDDQESKPLPSDTKLAHIPADTMYLGSKPHLCYVSAHQSTFGSDDVDDLRARMNLRNRGFSDLQHCHLIDLTMDDEGFIDAGAYIFLGHARSRSIDPHSMHPLVILVDDEPHESFLKFMAAFPRVYYYVGSMDHLNDLVLRNIINQSDVIVITRDAMNDDGDEDYMADTKAITTVASCKKAFPNVTVIAELVHQSNVRFMAFEPHGVEGGLGTSDTGAFAPEYRAPYISGQVFSASMIETLLYQSFSKDYVIPLMRSMLGIDTNAQSSVVSCIDVDEELLDKLNDFTYNSLCHYLLLTLGCLPIGLKAAFHLSNTEMAELEEVQRRQMDTSVLGDDEEEAELKQMRRLGKGQKEQRVISDKNASRQFVLCNPPLHVTVAEGDKVFVLKKPQRLVGVETLKIEVPAVHISPRAPRRGVTPTADTSSMRGTPTRFSHSRGLGTSLAPTIPVPVNPELFPTDRLPSDPAPTFARSSAVEMMPMTSGNLDGAETASIASDAVIWEKSV